jgi:hypothetical protein
MLGLQVCFWVGLVLNFIFLIAIVLFSDHPADILSGEFDESELMQELQTRVSVCIAV